MQKTIFFEESKEPRVLSLSKKIHFLGIGGVGMSAIAQILLDLGYPVSGSDVKESHYTQRLRLKGAQIFIGHKKNNIDPDELQCVVVSSAVLHDNVEVQYAHDRGIPILQRAEMLNILMRDKKGIAVAGTHGKTTTTSMVSFVLQGGGLAPTCVIGGEVNDFGGNARLGTGSYLVAEADESDGSFLKLSPQIGVITNIEADHLDYYADYDQILKSFQNFVSLIPPSGFVVGCLDDPGVAQLYKNSPSQFVTYGIQAKEADFKATNIDLNPMGSKSVIWHGDTMLGELTLKVPGRHNVLNALAAVALGRKIGISFENIAISLNSFMGAKRRFQVLGEIQDVVVVDDYGHHPTEIKATLASAKTWNRRVITLFQPHRYSRLKALMNEFATAFEDSDIVMITEVYGAGEKPIKGITGKKLADKIKKIHPQKQVHFVKDKDKIVDLVLPLLQPGDLVLTQGAGDITNLGFPILKNLQENQPLRLNAVQALSH